MPDERPPVYHEGPNTIYRASSIGRCLGELTRIRLGADPSPPPEWMERAWAEGRDAEADLIERTYKDAHLVPIPDIDLALYGQVDEDGQVTLEMRWSKFIIRCHPDGIAQEASWEGRVGLETKFVGEAIWNKLVSGPAERAIHKTPYYAYQIAVEMAVLKPLGIDTLYLGIGKKDPDTRELVDFTVRKFTTPPYTSADIKKRVAQIEMAVRNREIPACDWAMFPCGFFPEHDTTTETSVWFKGRETPSEELRGVVERYFAGKKMTDEASKQYREMMKDVESGTRYEGFTHVTRPGSRRVDWAKLAKDQSIGEDVIDKYRGKPGAPSVYPKATDDD